MEKNKKDFVLVIAILIPLIVAGVIFYLIKCTDVFGKRTDYNNSQCLGTYELRTTENNEVSAVIELKNDGTAIYKEGYMEIYDGDKEIRVTDFNWKECEGGIVIEHKQYGNDRFLYYEGDETRPSGYYRCDYEYKTIQEMFEDQNEPNIIYYNSYIKKV